MEFEPICINCCDVSQTCEHVLSCGDFLCGACEQKFKFGGKCPECHKQVAKLCISGGQSALPEDVAKNLRDISDAMESLYDVIRFQLMHYKKIMKISCQVCYSYDIHLQFSINLCRSQIICDGYVASKYSSRGSRKKPTAATMSA